MKKSFAMSLAALAVMTASSTASAFFFDSDDDWKCMGPYGEIPDCNPYDEWDPRYWMEEMEQVMDDDDYGYGYGAPYGGGYGAPYGGG
ncbi:MAG: hypothetical protein HKP55_13530, partial [Gammaproteobacteria bacterium]|nr:hypothetical protein [Gammaproteobacteria bacterium]